MTNGLHFQSNGASISIWWSRANAGAVFQNASTQSSSAEHMTMALTQQRQVLKEVAQDFCESSRGTNPHRP